jgi:hypothetical protein
MQEGTQANPGRPQSGSAGRADLGSFLHLHAFQVLRRRGVVLDVEKLGSFFRLPRNAVYVAPDAAFPVTAPLYYVEIAPTEPGSPCRGPMQEGTQAKPGRPQSGNADRADLGSFLHLQAFHVLRRRVVVFDVEKLGSLFPLPRNVGYVAPNGSCLFTAPSCY